MANKLQTYAEPEIGTRLASLPGWHFEDGESAGGTRPRLADDTDVRERDRILRGRSRPSSRSEGPWGKLVVALSTHSAGGITDKDFDLARRIEDIARWHPAVKGESTSRSRSPFSVLCSCSGSKVQFLVRFALRFGFSVPVLCS